MTERVWKISEPGILALAGTDFRILYVPKHESSFEVLQGDRPRCSAATLGYAKSMAEQFQSELEEIGVA